MYEWTCNFNPDESDMASLYPDVGSKPKQKQNPVERENYIMFRILKEFRAVMRFSSGLNYH